MRNTACDKFLKSYSRNLGHTFDHVSNAPHACEIIMHTPKSHSHHQREGDPFWISSSIGDVTTTTTIESGSQPASQPALHMHHATHGRGREGEDQDQGGGQTWGLIGVLSLVCYCLHLHFLVGTYGLRQNYGQNMASHLMPSIGNRL